MTLEQKTESVFYTVDGTHMEVPLDCDTLRKRPYELVLNAGEYPFLIRPTSLRGEVSSELDLQPVRIARVSLPITSDTRGFKRLARQTEPIPAYGTLQDALYHLLPKTLPHQRDNAAKFFRSIDRITGVLPFESGSSHGILTFDEGYLCAARLETGHEHLHGEKALTAFLLLMSYRPLTFTNNGELLPLDKQGPDYTGAGLNRLSPAAIPAYAHALRERLERSGLASHLFNIHEPNGTPEPVSDPNYAVGLTVNNKPTGVLRFRNNQYIDGKMLTDKGNVGGDPALAYALSLADTEPSATFCRIDNPSILERPVVGQRARQTALATTVEYLYRNQQ